MKLRLGVAIAMVSAACGGGSGAPATSSTTSAATSTSVPAATTTLPPSGTLWGFTPFPTRPGLNGVIDAYRIADDHGNLIAHHLDECVPWDALENLTELPYDLVDDLQLRTEQTPRDATILVAMSLSTVTRDGVAPDCGGVVGDRTFSDPAVVSAAKAWVDLLIARLEPVYLDVGVEFNLVGRKRPDLEQGLEDLIITLVDHVHLRHPGVVVLATVQFDTMADVMEVERVAGAVDLLGVSLYPTAYGATTPPAEDALDDLASLGAPLAISGTGWPGAPTIVDETIVPFTEQTQSAYVEWLGVMAERHRMRFVIWFYPGDPAPVFTDGGEVSPELLATAELYARMGLVADDRIPRAALEVWDRLRAGG